MKRFTEDRVEHRHVGLRLKRVNFGTRVSSRDQQEDQHRERKDEAVQNRYKSYADKHRKDREFTVGDHVVLKVSPVRGVVRFGQKRGKLSPRYIGPFEILERVGKGSYRLALPPKMSRVHNVFHINMLRK